MTDFDDKREPSRDPGSIDSERGAPADPEEQVALLLRIAGARPAVDPERTERVKAAVLARWRAEVRARSRVRLLRRMAVPMAAAAALVAMVGIGRWLVRSRAVEGGSPAALLERKVGPVRRDGGVDLIQGGSVPAGSEIVTGAGGRAALRVSTGVSIRLDSLTSVRFESDRSIVLRQGAIYLDSGEGKGASPEVRTSAGVVRDVGTRFQVRLAEEALLISVREGAASLELPDRTLAIQAGTRLAAGTGGRISRSAISPSDPDWDWIHEITPPYRLEGKTLGEFLGWVERETGRPVRFREGALAPERAAIVLHGSVEGMRPDETPAAVLPTCGLTSHRDGDALVVESLDAPEGSK